MNIQPLQFNPELALKSGGNSDFFQGNSEQRVKITRAEMVTTSTNQPAIIIDVMTNDKKRGYFRLNYGSNEFQLQKLQSLMGVTGVQGLTPVSITVPKYNPNTKQIENVQCINAQELIGKVFIGLFMNNYEIYQGKKQAKTELYVPFNTNRQTYAEMVNNQPASEIDRLLPLMLKKSQEHEAKIDGELGGFNPNASYNMSGQNSFDNDPFATPEPINTSYQRNPLPQNHSQNNYQPQGLPQQNYGNVGQPTQGFNNQVGNVMPIGNQVVDDDVPF